MKKTVCLILSAILIIASIGSGVCFADEAGSVELSKKIIELRSIYPDGSFWTGSYNNKSWSCMGWAETVCDYLFDENPRLWEERYDYQNISVGDHVRLQGGSFYSGGHSVVITDISDGIYYYADCNAGSPNMVQWDHTMTPEFLAEHFAWYKTKSENDVKHTYSKQELLDMGIHIHSYETWVYFTYEHPHYNCYQCSCGAVIVNKDECRFMDGCERCEQNGCEFYLSKENDVIEETYARVYTSLEKDPGRCVTDAGIYIWKQGEAEPTEPVYFESFKDYDSYRNREQVFINYKISAGEEVNYPLVPATTYFYRIVCIVDEKEFSTETSSFTTLGGEMPSEIQENGEDANKFVLTVGSREASVWGKKVTSDTEPVIVGGRAMLPARFIAENLGAEVSWNEADRMMIIKKKMSEIWIVVDSDEAYTDGRKTILDSAPFIKQGRTYTPVRFIVENLGYSVLWNADTKQIIIEKKAIQI